MKRDDLQESVAPEGVSAMWAVLVWFRDYVSNSHSVAGLRAPRPEAHNAFTNPSSVETFAHVAAQLDPAERQGFATFVLPFACTLADPVQRAVLADAVAGCLLNDFAQQAPAQEAAAIGAVMARHGDVIRRVPAHDLFCDRLSALREANPTNAEVSAVVLRHGHAAMAFH